MFMTGQLHLTTSPERVKMALGFWHYVISFANMWYSCYGTSFFILVHDGFRGCYFAIPFVVNFWYGAIVQGTAVNYF